MPSLGAAYVNIRGDMRGLKDDLNKALDMIKGVDSRVDGMSKNMTKSFLGAALGARGLELAVFKLKTALVDTFRAGFNAVEDFKMSTASLASIITTFSQKAKTDLPGAYKEAYAYSGLLVKKMEEWDAKTVATGKNITAMVETLAQGGVIVDVYNKKHEEGIIAIANALAIVTQGQNADIQFRQEIRGLVDGEVKSTNRLATIINNAIGGGLKENLAKWKEQGTLIENVGTLLSGFSAGAKDLENTWQAISSTMETISNRILRDTFAPVYEDIIKSTKQVTLNIMAQGEGVEKVTSLLREGLYKGWEDIKNITKSVADIIATFKGPLVLVGELIAVIADGWGMIFAILPAITERIKLIGQSMWSLAEAGYAVYESLYNAAKFDFSAAAASIDKAKNKWNEAGRQTGAAFSGGLLDEFDKALGKYNQKLSGVSSSSGAKAPLMAAIVPDAGDVSKEMKKTVKVVDDALSSFFDEIDDTQKKIEGLYRSWATPMSKQLQGFQTQNDLMWDSINQEIEAGIEADKNALDEREKEYKSFLKQREEDEKHTLERIQDATADAYYDIFKDIGSGFKSLFDNVKNWFLKLMAEMAAKASMPIVIKIVQSVVGGGALGASTAFGADGSGSSTGLLQQAGSYLWNNTGVGSTLSNWMGLSGGSSYFGGGASALSSMGSLYGVGGQSGSQIIASSLGEITPSFGAYGELTSTAAEATSGIGTFTQALSKATPYLLAYSAGSMGYGYLADATGLPQGKYSSMGAGLGAAGGYALGAGSGIAAGATMGSVVPVIGTIIGAIVGGIAGSLLSTTPNKKKLDLAGVPGYDSTFSFYDTPGLGSKDLDTAQWGNNSGVEILDAMRETVLKTVSATKDGLVEWLEVLPEDLAASIERDIAKATVDLGGALEVTSNRGADRIEAGLTQIAETTYNAMLDAITPIIENDISKYLAKEIGGMSGTLDMLTSKHSINKFLGNTGIFNADYTKAKDAEFEDYTAATNEVLTALTQIQGAWDAVSTGFDRMIKPLSSYKSEMESQGAVIDQAIAALENLGFNEEHVTKAREKGALALEAVTKRYADSIDEQLTDAINQATLSAEDYNVWKAGGELSKTLEAIAELGPDYAYLADKAQQVFDITVAGIDDIADAAEALSNFARAQMHWNGFDDTEIGMKEISNRYGWDSAKYGDTGNYNWEAIVADSITPFLEITEEEFDAFAKSIGVSSDILMDDITFLSDTFNDLDGVIKDSIVSWEDLSNSIRDQILKLQTSSSNPADIFERIVFQEQAITDKLGGQDLNTYLNSLGSDAERATSIKDLQALYGDRLTLNQEAYQRPSLEYQGAFSQTIGDLSALGDYAGIMKSEYQLQYEQVDLLQQIANNTSSLATIPQYADGGYTPGGLVFTHPNELILNPKQQAAVTTKNDSGANVNIVIHAHGGNSDEVANKAVAKLLSVLPSALGKGTIRSAVQRAASGR